jgi:hypothetical protein
MTRKIRYTIKKVLSMKLRGDGFPLTIAITLALLLIFCGISEYFRVSLITQGIRDAVQQSVIAVINDNYNDVYHPVREGYAAGYYPTDTAWDESVDLGDVYANLSATLGMSSSGGGYAKYAGEALEYRISGLAVEISNNGLASGESEGYLADCTIDVEIPMSFAGSILPPLNLTLKTQAKYIPLF